MLCRHCVNCGISPRLTRDDAAAPMRLACNACQADMRRVRWIAV